MVYLRQKLGAVLRTHVHDDPRYTGGVASSVVTPTQWFGKTLTDPADSSTFQGIEYICQGRTAMLVPARCFYNGAASQGKTNPSQLGENLVEADWIDECIFCNDGTPPADLEKECQAERMCLAMECPHPVNDVRDFAGCLTGAQKKTDEECDVKCSLGYSVAGGKPPIIKYVCRWHEASSNVKLQHPELGEDIACLPSVCNVNFPIGQLAMFPGVSTHADVATWYGHADTPAYEKTNAEYIRTVVDADLIQEHNYGLVHDCTGVAMGQTCTAKCSAGWRMTDGIQSSTTIHPPAGFTFEDWIHLIRWIQSSKVNPRIPELFTGC